MLFRILVDNGRSIEVFRRLLGVRVEISQYSKLRLFVIPRVCFTKIHYRYQAFASYETSSSAVIRPIARVDGLTATFQVVIRVIHIAIIAVKVSITVELYWVPVFTIIRFARHVFLWQILL